MRAAWLVLVVMLCGCSHEHGPSAGELIRSADAEFGRGDFLSAAALYEQASELAPEAVEPSYDLALAYYRTNLYDMTVRYLDRAQEVATGPSRVRCLLLRGDVEYRKAMAEDAVGRVEGLQRALYLYREALGAASDKVLRETARYDVEVVKLKLPVARGEAPAVRSSGEVVDTTAEDMSFEAGRKAMKSRRNTSGERDW